MTFEERNSMDEIFANGATITTGIVIVESRGWFANVVLDNDGIFKGVSFVANQCDATQYDETIAKRIVAFMNGRACFRSGNEFVRMAMLVDQVGKD